MSPFVFDTLGASKQLREAGMPEGVAEAVVSVFQHAAAMPDISHLATKADFADMATWTDLAELRQDMKAGFAELRAEFSAKLLQQTWMMIGGVTALVTMVNVMLKIFD